MDDPDVSTWPFWAPSDLASVEQALDLAGLVEGETLVDLGCGDGQVLVAAARRGAHVIGVESDPELADLARTALADHDRHGEVIEGDLFDVDIDADVYFTYLAPATLQRLFPALASRPRARVVSVDFDIPGLEPDEWAGAARLYRMPGRPRQPSAPGWSCAAALVVVPSDRQSLTVLDLVHPGGDVAIRLRGSVASAGSVLAGADRLGDPAHLAVDIRWEDRPPGTLVVGALTVTGVEALPLFVVFDDAEEDGCWELSTRGAERLRRHVEGGGETDAGSLVRAGRLRRDPPSPLGS